MKHQRRPAPAGDFRLAAELDPELLEKIGATSDMPRGRICDLIKEYLIRRGRTCAVCSREFDRRNLFIGHRKHPSDGGGDNVENLQLLCRRCAELKGGRSMLDVRKQQRLLKLQRKNA
jgi:5-methylcytosine-specific restriction endonuclease McrA